MRLTCPWCGEETSVPDGVSTATCENCGETFSPSDADVPTPEELSTWIMSDEEKDPEGQPRRDIRPSDLEQMQALFQGKYEVMELMGRGGMGAVYKARQVSPRRLVGLKVLLGGHFASEAQHKRFKREAQAIALLKHPGIVQVYEFGEASGQPYFTMDYVEGTNLKRYVREKKLGAKDICRLMVEVADAVYYAHTEGVIHADLKPENILVDDDGRPHVLDFGLARIARRSELSMSRITKTGTVTGTPKYMSPEQTLGKPQEIDERTDVYSLGVILYELLTSHSPYRPDDESVYSTMKSIREEEPTPPTAFSAQVDRELQAMLYQALEKDRERRYQTAQALKEDLERYVDGQPVNAVPPSLFYRAKKAFRRNWKTWVPVGTGVLLVLIAAVLFAMQRSMFQTAAENPVAFLAAMDAPEKVRNRVGKLMKEGDWMKAYLTAQFAAEMTPKELGLEELPEEVAREARAHTKNARQRVERLVKEEKWVEAFQEAMMATRAAPKGSGSEGLVQFVLRSARPKVRLGDLRRRFDTLLEQGDLLAARPVMMLGLYVAPRSPEVQAMKEQMQEAMRRRLPPGSIWQQPGMGRGAGPGGTGRNLQLRPKRTRKPALPRGPMRSGDDTERPDGSQ